VTYLQLVQPVRTFGLLVRFARRLASASSTAASAIVGRSCSLLQRAKDTSRAELELLMLSPPKRSGIPATVTVVRCGTGELVWFYSAVAGVPERARRRRRGFVLPG
jgi:hypothetical protein